MKIHGDCPNCKEKVTIDIDKLEVKTPKTLDNASTEGQTQLLEQKPVEPEIKTEIKTVIEDFKPGYECPDGNCDQGGIHKNKNYSKKVKGKCSNCDQFSRNNKGSCPWCEKNDTIEEMDSEELEELGIRNPPEQQIKEHTHE